ncbi:hypothetical protein GCM10007424_22510 [Flavobacterium suaedae]|uniref:Restriction endonuclease type IV Mrr domain-containing protein n=1 Tax=Flavobacterium suaedae TaxID=1767027 RepID=A0ABQ1JYL3_9FLAO|nr:restriction endonuclease [Flavobacterium suaedae]GGB81953.1 hypothetical protein GCM10007424_22510 [Flavobacterium suaedae]
MIFDDEPQTWSQLQNYVGKMFTECGFETEVSKVVELVRGQKEIDVITQDLRSEYKPTILIECKFWKEKVNQEIVHSFRTVVNDFGANLGFIVSKNGFQSGCYEAAKNTNIRLVSLKELEAEYYKKWLQGMVEKYMPYADKLFPYWDYTGTKMPNDGGKIDFEKQQLIFSAYKPICAIGPSDIMLPPLGFIREYPIIVPIIDDRLIQIGEKSIETDRQYFDFVEDNKERALKHFKILYRE